MRFLRDQTGAAVIEFAVVGSVFLLLLVGSIQAGLLWWTKNGLQTAAMLTARCAAMGSCSDPNAFAVATASQFGLGNAITATVTPVSGSTCSGPSTGYSKFTSVTITSTYWAGALIAPLAGTSLVASACYPSPTGS